MTKYAFVTSRMILQDMHYLCEDGFYNMGWGCCDGKELVVFEKKGELTESERSLLGRMGLTEILFELLNGRKIICYH